MKTAKASRVEYMGRKAVLLANDEVQALVETVGGDQRETGQGDGRLDVVAAWLHHCHIIARWELAPQIGHSNRRTAGGIAAPRPHHLLDQLKAKFSGQPFDQKAFDAALRQAVVDVVRKQVVALEKTAVKDPTLTALAKKLYEHSRVLDSNGLAFDVIPLGGLPA